MVEQAVALTGQKRYIVVAIAVAIGFVSFVFGIQSSRSDIPDHGDWRGDMSQVIAARNFASYGFSFLRFGAMQDSGLDVGLAPAYNTQAPSFPAVALGALYQLGLSTAEARLLPLLIASSALVALYILAHRMLGDWRAGIAALLALASSAPFRLLSDSLGSPAYDFAAEIWTMLFISLAGLARGWRRLAWLIIAGASALCTVWLSGVEAVPAIVAYGFLFPLLCGGGAGRTGLRIHLAFWSGLLVVVAVLAGGFLFVSHNARLLGGWQPAIDELRQLFDLRTATNLGFIWTGQYITLPTTDYLLYYVAMLIDRSVAYLPIQMAIVAFAVGIGGLLAGLLEGQANWRPIRWVAAVFLSEAVGLALFRQYTNEHVDAIRHLSIPMSLAVALGITFVWRLVGPSAWRQTGVAVGIAALFVASMADIGVKPYGNLPSRVDWTQQRQRVEALMSLTPANAVIVMDTGDQDPSWQLFAGRTIVQRPEVHWLNEARGRPWFLVIDVKLDNYTYRSAIEAGSVMSRIGDVVLFDMNPRPERPKVSSGTPGVP